ncbi:MAG TPA: hypothetical protein VHE33_05325 [Acidobacteriaceae bacterium]|nr:hypothetical protein [Acidobacteriaceae bacterium]
MATSAQSSPVVSSAKRVPGTAGRYFYFFMSLLIAATVIYGFSHTVNQNLLHANPIRPWLLWVHGTLFSAWVGFFILQSALVRTRNVALHRVLGWFGVALAAAMTVVGLWTSIVMGRFDVAVLNEKNQATFLLVPFWDIACFAACFGLAVLWRKKPELHRRLMLIATCALTAAAWGRMPVPPAVGLFFYVGVDALIVLGVVRDLVVTRRVHKVYLWALPVFAVGQFLVMRVILTAPAWWMKIAHALVG